MALTGFTTTSFAHEGVEKPVLRRGDGPGVVLLPEPPGITPTIAALATRVADAGFTVAVPQLFGVAGKPMSGGYALGSLVKLCVSREFSLLAAHRSSPVTSWLRALCRALHEELGGPGVGAIGMCITGNFVIALMVDASVAAPVACQPALPLPIGEARASSLHVSPEQLTRAKERARAGVPLLAFRFSEDPKCPAARFETLRREFGERFDGVEIDSSPSNPHGVKSSAHSVLTYDFVDEDGHPTRAALDKTLAFLRARLAVDAVP